MYLPAGEGDGLGCKFEDGLLERFSWIRPRESDASTICSLEILRNKSRCGACPAKGGEVTWVAIESNFARELLRPRTPRRR